MPQSAPPPAPPPTFRVLHVYKTYFPDTRGGIEQAIRQIRLATQPLGVTSTLLTLSRAPAPRLLQLPEGAVWRYPVLFEAASCPVSVRAAPAFRRLAREADVVHYHFPWPYADLLALALPPGRPAVVTYHSDIVRQRLLLPLYRPLMGPFLGRAARVIFPSPNLRSSSVYGAAAGERGEVIPYGLDEASYPAPDEGHRAEMRERFGPDFFLFVGVARYYKGLSYLLEAARDAPFTVIIAGDGPLRPELMRRAEALGLGNVHFPGAVSEEEKVALLSLCRAFVLPSHLRSEAFGISLLEAAMMGRPLISTELGTGTSFVNADGETGIVVPPADAQALRDAMLALHGNPARAKAMGRAARHRYEVLFTAERMGKLYQDLYRRVVQPT